MLHSRQGSIYRVVLACFIGLAFCFALSWPQYSKYQNVRHLSKAEQLGRAIAFAEESYKQVHGNYTPQFGELDLSLPCPLVDRGQGTQLECPHYVYQLDNTGVLKVTHKQLPVWLDIDIAAGTVSCKHAENDWAGQDLCARMQ